MGRGLVGAGLVGGGFVGGRLVAVGMGVAVAVGGFFLVLVGDIGLTTWVASEEDVIGIEAMSPVNVPA